MGVALPAPTARRNIMVVAARRSLVNELQSIREQAEPGKRFRSLTQIADWLPFLALNKRTCPVMVSAVATLEYESPLSVVLYPDPRLRAKNKRIASFDEKLQELVQEMFDVMYRTDGVGLSAPQVGVNVRLMVYNPEGERGKGQEYVLVNPKIVKYGKKTEEFVEGCLSFPTIEASVEVMVAGCGEFSLKAKVSECVEKLIRLVLSLQRPLTVRVEAQDIKGKKFSINLKDFQARIFQHEYDHLEVQRLQKMYAGETKLCPFIAVVEQQQVMCSGFSS